MKDEIGVLRLRRKEVVAGNCLNPWMFSKKLQEMVVLEHEVVASTRQRCQAISEVPFQNGIDGRTSILKDVVMEYYVPRSGSRFALYPRPHVHLHNDEELALQHATRKP